MKMFRAVLTVCCLLIVTGVYAQKTASVTGRYTYVVGENDPITLKDARQKCIELAKAEAIKSAFGEMVTSDVINTNVESNGGQASSYFWENTVAIARGDWLGDTKPAKVDIVYSDGKLLFTAEVWGKAREIVQAKTDLHWNIQRDAGDRREQTTQFAAGDRIYVGFRAPANGYVAVYLIEGDDNTSCLLPYPREASGQHSVKGGKDLVFFDKAEDPSAVYYKLNTKREQEDNQIVLIYSPNPFTKCNDITGDAAHPHSLSTHDFQKWLLRCQRNDRDMVVVKKWVRIVGS